MVKTRPLVYFFVAYYKDGNTLPQYDTQDYHTNKFEDINQENLIKFGLYPFPDDLAKGVIKNGTEVASIPFLPTYEIEFNKDKRLIYYRDCYISQDEYHLCGKCKKEFKLSPKIKKTKSKYSSPICPHCGAYDNFFCKKCKKDYIFEKTANGLCPICKGYMDRRKLTSSQYIREKRWNEYIIGYQLNINGINKKFLMRIHENGDCEVI